MSFSLTQAAWQEPTTDPTGGNTTAPINVSSQGQAKEGGLTVGSNTLNTSATLYSNGSLGVKGNSTLSGTLKVSGNSTLSGTFTVAGASILQNTLNAQKAADFDSTTNFDGVATFRGGITAYDGVTTRFWVNNSADKVLINSAQTTLNGSLVVGAAASQNGIYVSSTTGNAIYARSTSSYALQASTSATNMAGIYVQGGNNSSGIWAINNSATKPALDVDNSATSTSMGGAVAVHGQSGSILASASGSRYSYGVYGMGGDTTGIASTQRKTYGVYGQAGSVSSGGNDTSITYGMYGDDGSYSTGYSYAGYFDGTTQMCKGAAYCAAFAANNMSAIFSKGSVYFTKTSPIQGNYSVDTATLIDTERRDRQAEEHAIRVNGGLYLSNDGNQIPGTILMHDQLFKDRIYRIEIVGGVLNAVLLSRCQAGLRCKNDNTVVEVGFNGDYTREGAGCKIVKDNYERCNQRTDGKIACLNGACVTECEAKGYFCSLATNPMCGATITENGYSCGSGNSLSCCTGT